MVLDDLFNVHNGLSSSELALSDLKTDEYDIAFLRPSNSWENLIVGYARREDVPAKYIFPKDSLFVSTNGEGSHSYSYVSPIEFVPNSDIAVLIPKKNMELREKVFYAMCITKNRYRFSYGRKPKGDKLNQIILPAHTANWVDSIKFPTYKNLNFNGDENKQIGASKLVPITKLFEITYGTKLDLNKMVISPSKDQAIAFVSRTARNLGIVSFVEEIESINPYPKGLLTVALGGSILSTFLQPHPFYTAQNVMVLKPKKDMSEIDKIFYCMCIEQNKFKYSAFGREANNTFKTLLIPENVPGWLKKIDMQKYIAAATESTS